MIPEIWVPIDECDGLIEISNHGRVRSYKGIGCRPRKVSTPKLIKLCIDGRGYQNFSASGTAERKYVLLIHRQVAKYFIPNPNGFKIVRHLNDIKTDNHVTNLAWGTYTENRADGIKNGKHFHTEGKRAVQAKLNGSQVKEIYQSAMNNCELGRRYNVTESTVSKIKLGRAWNHITGLPRIK